MSLATGQNVRPEYPGLGFGGSEKAFLLNVVIPIYEVIRKVSADRIVCQIGSRIPEFLRAEEAPGTAGRRHFRATSVHSADMTM